MLDNIGCGGYFSKVTMGITSFLSLVAVIFIICSLAAWSEDADPIKNAAWNHISSSGTDYYFGFRSFSVVSSGTSFTFNYDSDTCKSASSDFCNTCADAGKTSFALNIVAIFLALGLFVLSILRTVGDQSLFKTFSVVLSVAVLALLAGAFGNWINTCQSKIKDLVNSSVKVDYGPGFDIDAAAFAITVIVLFLHFFTTVSSAK